MIKKIKILFIVLLCQLFVGCNKIPTTRPSDFGFILYYGFAPARNKVDTFNGIITKDLIADGDTTVTFKFTNGQLDTIYNIVREIDYFGYPDGYSPEGASIFPSPETRITITVGERTKKLHWLGPLVKRDDKRKIGFLCDYIISTVKASEEYQKLPKTKGGYM